MSGITVKSYSFVLACLYCLIVLLAFFQISRIFYYRHNVFHYQFGFLIFTFLWGILRAIFWLWLPWALTTEMLLQGFALNIQFATFTFLVLFFQQIIHKANNTWKDQGFYSIFSFIFINIIFFLLFLLTILLYFVSDSAIAYRVHVFFAAIMYFFLAFLLGLFGFKLFYLVAFEKISVPFLKSKFHIGGATIFLVLIYLSRGIKDFLAGFDIGTMDLADPIGVDTGSQIILFTYYFLWDIVPALSIIFIFWHIPTGSSQNSNIGQSALDPQNILGDSDSVQPQLSFKVLSRYDSEEENNLTSSTGAQAPIQYSIQGASKKSPFGKNTAYNAYNTRSPLLNPSSLHTSGKYHNNNTSPDESL